MHIVRTKATKGGVDRGYDILVQYIINGERVFVHLQNKE